MLNEKRKKREKRKERKKKKTTTYLLTISITVRSAILHVKHAGADSNYLPRGSKCTQSEMR